STLARATRPNEPEAPDFVRECVTWGAGPRASRYLVLGAKARAALYGHMHPREEDVAAVALPVLRHRILTNYQATDAGLNPDKIVQRLLETIPKPTEPRR